MTTICLDPKIPLGRIKPTDVKAAVDAFNSRYGEMEQVLWRLSRAAVDALLAGKDSQAIEKLVWTVRSWWGVQGVRKETKVKAAATLLEFDWTESMFEASLDLEFDSKNFAVRRVAEFVEGMRRRGAARREWSLASKVLHWLMPWRVPAYDGFVRGALGVPSGIDNGLAYSFVVTLEYGLAHEILQQGEEWFGDLEPRSPFRALDKYLWWHGGGSADRAVVVKNPWRVLDPLNT